MTKDLVSYLESVDIHRCSVEDANAIYSLSERLARHQMNELTVISSLPDLERYVRNIYMPLHNEVMGIIFLDAHHGVLGIEEMFHGTVDAAPVYPRKVVETALRYGSCSCFLFHNHPSGDITPSDADRHITDRLKSALSLIDVRILDHIVVGKNGIFSFVANHFL